MVWMDIRQFLLSSLTDQIVIMDSLFEHSDSLITLTLKQKSFMDNGKWCDYSDFIHDVKLMLLNLCDNVEFNLNIESMKDLQDILNSHPRLGEIRKTLSIYSSNEQQTLRLSDNSSEISLQLQKLNDAYEKKYKGLRFILFVNRRSQKEVIEMMKKRIESCNSWYDECRISINEIYKIAKDRIASHADTL